MAVSSVRGERGKVLQAILESLQHSAEMETWGLIVEAAEDYQKTYYKLKHTTLPESNTFTPEEKELFARIGWALHQKAASLQDLSSVQEPSSATKIDVKKIQTALQGLLQGTMSAAAIESTLEDTLPSASSVRGQTAAGMSSSLDDPDRSLTLADDEYSKAIAGKAGSLITRKDILSGYSYLTITIDKIGLKDPQNYIDPFITVSVKSLVAEDIEASQDTPVASDREPSHINFNVPVQIQLPIEDIPGGAAIFFEFKHYKPKKSAISTKCFSFMEMDEIKPGKAFLELYNKPTDFRRKKLTLLSIKKPLYLHLTLALDKTT